MKGLTMMLIALALTTGAVAQKVVRGGGHVVRVKPVVVATVAPYYGWGMAYHPYWGYLYYNSFYMHARPTKLDLQIADIRNDYQQRISSARSDKSLSKSERKKIIRDLKYERDNEIIEAKRSYYKTGR